MKITDPDVISQGEKELIEAVKEDLDLDTIKEILKNRLTASTLSARGGEIVVHNNQIAFRLDFDLNLSGSLMFDRQGNFIAESEDTEDEELPIPDDLDLDDININDALEEVSPGLPDQGPVDSDLPEPADVDGDVEEIETDLETGMEPDMDLPDINLPDYDPDEDTLPGAADNDADDTGAQAPANDDPEGEPADDMNDILKDSRDFWEQKKES